jgi:uncharacterized protein YdhG (YjbR/CyaY superfamily)
MTPKPKTIDEYIARFPIEIQLIMEDIRHTIKIAAPEAEETIKYGMPTFLYHGNLVYFAAFKNHIGFYPAPTGIKEFAKEISTFKSGKGSLQLPFDKPMPLKLINKILKYYIARNLNKK